MPRRPDQVKACPRCGGDMDVVGTWEGRYNDGSSKTFRGVNLTGENRRVDGKYAQCESCGHWENWCKGTDRVRSVGNIGGQLNFDNEDGWPCR